jgi:hypothetical protein
MRIQYLPVTAGTEQTAEEHHCRDMLNHFEHSCANYVMVRSVDYENIFKSTLELVPLYKCHMQRTGDRKFPNKNIASRRNPELLRLESIYQRNIQGHMG